MPSESAPSLERRAATALTWLRVEMSGPLARAGYRPRRRKGEQPLPAIATILQDGVVLAEVLVFLDALPHASVLRTPRRPASVPDGAAIDRRYIDQQYKQNTRRVVHTLGKIFEHLRAEPLPLGALLDYLGGDVAAVSPHDNVAPSIALVELVIAAAMYGPRSAHFVWSIWHLPCATSKHVLQHTMSNVARFLRLIPFEEVVAKASDAMPDMHPQPPLPPQPPRHAETFARGQAEEGMGDRKISMVTEDGGNSPDAAEKSFSKFIPHHAQHLHVNPVQVSHSAIHGLGPTLQPHDLPRFENDSEYMTQRLAYNEANARLQEVARTRALVSRLEGSVRGSRGMYVGQPHRPSGGPAQPPPLNSTTFSPLPPASSFLPPTRSAVPPPSVPVGTPKHIAALSPRPSPVIALDHLGQPLERTPLQPFMQAPPAQRKESNTKENEFSSDEEGEEAAVAARNMHYGSALNEMPASMPAEPSKGAKIAGIREAPAATTSPVVQNISVPEPEKRLPAEDYFSSAVSEAPIGPSTSQDRVERTMSAGAGSSKSVGSDEARSSQFRQLQAAREAAKSKFVQHQLQFEDLSLSKVTTYDANEVIENELVVTDEEGEIRDYEEGDEELSIEEQEEVEEEAIVAQREAQRQGDLRVDSQHSLEHTQGSILGGTDSGTERPAGMTSSATAGLDGSSRKDGPGQNLHPSDSPIQLPSVNTGSRTTSPATADHVPLSSTGTHVMPPSSSQLASRHETANSVQEASVSPLPAQTAPVIAAPVTSSWEPVAASPASSAAHAQRAAVMQDVQISPSSLLPLPPLNLTPQRSNQAPSRLSRGSNNNGSPSAARSRVGSRTSASSQYSATGQQFTSPSQLGHPINFPYGHFSPMGSPGVLAPNSGRLSPAPMYIAPSVAAAAPGAPGYQSPSYIVHTVPVQNMVVHPQGVSPRPAAESRSYQSPEVRRAVSNQGSDQFALPPSAARSSPGAQLHTDTRQLRSPSPHARDVAQGTAEEIRSARTSQTSTSGVPGDGAAHGPGGNGDPVNDGSSPSSGDFVDARGSSSSHHSSGDNGVEKLVDSASGHIDVAAAKAIYSAKSDESPKLGDRPSVPYIPGTYAARASSGGIPNTPPSPPAVSDVVASFAVKTQDRPREDTRPVSTMMPSPRLFQKLISVWQHSADEDEAASATVTSQVKSPELHEGSTGALEEDKLSDDSGSSTPVTTDGPKQGASAGTPRSDRRMAMRVPVSPLQQPAMEPAPGTGASSSQPEAASRGMESSPVEKLDSDLSEEPNTQIRADDHWRKPERSSESAEWDAALNRETEATTVGEPSSSEITTSTASVARRARSNARSPVVMTDTQPQRLSQESSQSMSPAIPEPEDLASSSSPNSGDGIQLDGETVRVDPTRLDWLTQELLAARDAISRKDLALTLAEKDTTDQKEVLILEKQDAESVVAAMKHILAEREGELREARKRLSIAISGVSKRTPQSPRHKVPSAEEIEARIEAEAQRKADKMFNERARELQPQAPISPLGGNSDIMERFDRSDALTEDVAKRSNAEMNRLWGEVQVSMEEKMMQMINRRDTELAEMKIELAKRQKAMEELQEARLKLVDQNAFIKSEATSAKQERELIITQAAMEISQVQAQLVLVDKFSKKLHDTFKETEMLRAQVADSQAKMASFTSNAGISAREAKELREAVLRAQGEADRWRNVAESAKTEKKEAEHRAEELGRFYKNASQPVNSRYANREDGTFSSERSFDQVGHSRHRPGNSGSRHRDGSAEQVRTRAVATQDAVNPASRAWNSIKAIVTGKETKVGHRKPPRRPPPRRPPQYGQAQYVQHQSDEAQSPSAPYRSPQYSPRDFNGPQYPPQYPPGYPPQYGTRTASDHSESAQGSEYSGRSGRSGQSGQSGQSVHSGSRTGGSGRPPRSNRSGSRQPQSPELGSYTRRVPREQHNYDAAF